VETRSFKGWRRRFDDPIPLPRGRQLVTLKDAADYIMKLPKAEQNHERWQTAIHCPIRKTQPYAKKIAHKGIWVEPELLAEIEYRAKSGEGKVRHPFFRGLREDL
jgi:hypothetical protein